MKDEKLRINDKKDEVNDYRLMMNDSPLRRGGELKIW